MKNNPALAQQLMDKVESFIMKDKATLMPGRIYSCAIILDENGEIAHAVSSSGGGNFTGSTESEIHQFEAEQAAKKKRREEYERLAEESALKRKLMEQEAAEKSYQAGITSNAIPIAAYEQNMAAASILK